MLDATTHKLWLSSGVAGVAAVPALSSWTKVAIPYRKRIYNWARTISKTLSKFCRNSRMWLSLHSSGPKRTVYKPQVSRSRKSGRYASPLRSWSKSLYLFWMTAGPSTAVFDIVMWAVFCAVTELQANLWHLPDQCLPSIIVLQPKVQSRNGGYPFACLWWLVESFVVQNNKARACHDLS